MLNNFAIFILTHGRPDNVKTVRTLKKCGYTGKVYIVIDNEDKTAAEYYRIYGDQVIMFDKLKKSKEFDTADTFDNRKTIVYARNACFDIAKELGLDYFLELDDDYKEFRYRYENNGSLASVYVKSFDRLVDYMLEFLKLSGALTVAFSQTGDFIGGMGSRVFKERLTRKAMNSFFCATAKRFDFIGRLNEDVNSYAYYGTTGQLLFTVADVTLDQTDTQANTGGMTEVYLDGGTYVKSFYSVMINPSCVKISTLGMSSKRIHHLVNWEYCTPKIISSDYKKAPISV